MKTKSIIIPLIFITLLFNGCQKQETATVLTNIPDKIAISTQNTPKTSNTIKWKNFDKKYPNLSGIQYPDSFWVNNDIYSKELSALDRLEIKSSKNLNFDCTDKEQCDNNGMKISIFSSKATVYLREKNSNLSETTKYPNIRKIKQTGNAKINGITYDYYIFIPLSPDKTAYEIMFQERNFNGNSSSIIDGFLSSLHE
jgi:hypothetical protein